MAEKKRKYARKINNKKGIDETVFAIKPSHFKMLVKSLGDNSGFINRNKMIIEFAYSQLLRMEDVVSRKMSDVFINGKVRSDEVPFHDLKTGKADTLNLRPIKNDLFSYKKWRKSKVIRSKWLFPARPQSRKHSGYVDRHLTVHTYYEILKKKQKQLDQSFNWNDKFSCHLPRKQAATHIYNQTKNLVLVQRLLHHSSSTTTERYLHLSNQKQASAKQLYYDL